MHGSDLTCTRTRKAAWKKARKPRDTPQAWLRRLTCPFDFGLKVTTTDPETGKASSHPIHYNKNRDVLAAFRDKRRWRHVSRLYQLHARRPLEGRGDVLLHRRRVVQVQRDPGQPGHRLPRLGIGTGRFRGRRVPQGDLLPRPLPRAVHQRPWPPRLPDPRQVRPECRGREGTPEGPGAPPERTPARQGLRHRVVRDQGAPARPDVGRRRRGHELHGGRPGENPP